MKNIWKIIMPLVVIAIFIGLVLGVTYYFLGPKIDDTLRKEEQAALAVALSTATNFKPMTNEGKPYYAGYGQNDVLVGYVFKEGAIGYGGPIVTLVGIGTNSEVNSIVILSADQETPGLGNKCMEKRWQKQFSGLTAEQVPQDKAGFAANGLEAITGATYSSMAVARNVANAFAIYRKVHVVEGGNE